MTQKEQTRLQVLNSLLAEHMTLDQAATLMGVSSRHTRRILAAYREKGAAAVAHGHRGREPTNAIPEATRSRVVHLARTMYEGANHTHLSELLSEREGLDMGRTTLRRYPGERRAQQSAAKAPTEAPGPSPEDAPGGHADTDGWQLPPVAGRRRAPVHPPDRGGRCQRRRGQRPVLRPGGYQQLFPADAGTAPALRHSSRPLHRPSPGLQTPVGISARRGRQHRLGISARRDLLLPANPVRTEPWRSWEYN